MFKPIGAKRKQRGTLIDLPHGLKGVIVWERNGKSGGLFEHSTGSRLMNISKDNIIEKIAYAHFNTRDKIETIKENQKKVPVINSEIEYAKAKQTRNTDAPKKGQAEYEKVLTNGDIETNFGYPVKLEYETDAFVSYDEKEKIWKVIEKRSGLSLATGNTKSNAIENSNANIKKVTPERMEQMISKSENDKNVAKNKKEAHSAYEQLDRESKYNLWRDVYGSVIGDEAANENVDKEISDLGTIKKNTIVEKYISGGKSFDKYKPKATETKKDDTISDENKGFIEWLKNESNKPNGGEVAKTIKEVDKDILREDTRDESNTGTKRNDNQETNKENPTGGTSTSKQGPSTTTRAGDDDTGVQQGQGGYDTDNTTPSKEYGISAEDERVERYDTDGGSESDNQRGTDADTVLPTANNSDAIKLKNYDLTNKEPVSLTRGERKKINALTKEILQKPLNEITESDKDILRQYTGDGGLDDVTTGSVNQHYTNYETVKSMYEALSEAGFDFQRALEPAVGSGNFVGFASDKQWDIVDIDTTNINVATTLYPNAKPTNDTYETFKGKNYDLVISNVPFASTQSLMREHAMTIKPAFKAIHNFYFAHSIDKVKDNGIVAFMTSTGTMDGVKEAQNLRAYLMKKADIIGAFRLPENSQRENTHTDTMIDIIFLQKRPDGVKSRQEKLNESFVKIGKNQGHTINQYFIDNPTHLLGKVEIGRDRTKMGKEGWIVTGKPRYEDMKISYEPYKVENKKEQLYFKNPQEAIDYTEGLDMVYKPHDTGYKHIEFIDGKLYKFDEKITFIDYEGIGMFGKKAQGVNAKKLTDLNEIMTYAEDYARTKNENSKAKALELIKAYKSNHTKAPHSDTSLKKYAKENRFDLELKEYMSYFDKEFKPAQLFEEDVRFKDSGVLKVTAKSSYEERAMSVEDEDGNIDLSSENPIFPYSDVAKGLDQGLYAVSANKQVQNSIMYYSGNIYKKLDDLDTLLENKSINQEQYDKQHKKLKEILPTPTPYKDIKFKGVESWMPKDIQEKLIGRDNDGEWFLRDGFGIDGMQKHIVNNYLNGKTLVKRDQKNETTDEHRVKVLEANKLLREILLPKIHEKVEQLGLSETIENEYNKFASSYVEPKLTGYLLKDMPKQFRGKPFSMQSHQLEGAELVVYNKKGVIAFAPGGGKTITAIVAVKQLLNQGVMKKPLFVVPVNTIHQWEETVRELYPQASVFEFPKIQRGKNKGQAKEWKDLSKDEKEQMIYDLTNNRYDFTIIGDTAFQKIGIPSDKVEQYANDLAEQITAAEEVDEDGGKKEQKSGLSLEAKKAALAKGIAAQYDGDVTVDIDKLGFDAIIADEVQYYKNIGMQGKDTKGDLGTNISVKYYERNKEFNSALPTGVNNPEYIQLTQKDLKEGSEPDMAKLESWRSYDFRFKTRFISENNNGNNIILLTGTPTPNKPLELMTLLYHMDQRILDEYGIENVSDFVDTFLETETFETTDAQGKPKSVDGLGGIRNAQWLKKIIKRYVNYKGFEDMPDLPRPKQVDIKHYLSLSPAGEEIFGDILHRLVKSLEDSKSKTVSPENMEQPITMYGLGRDASIDLRLYNVGTKGKGQYTQEEIQKLILEDERTSTNNKTKKVVNLVTKQYKENTKSGQIIFNDRIKYKDENGVEKYIHSELRDEILASGLFEPNEVVIVTGQLFVNPETGNLRKGNLDNKLLQRIINDYNEGKIKVIIGNTAKLGVGVDLNKYTTDIYQMDIPYRPDEIEQRNNRGVRQGNINPEVRVHSFFQIGTFDKFSFDLIKKKEGFNNVYWKDVDGSEVTLDRGDNVDPYEMMIQIEKDVYKREKLRLERIIDQSAFIQKDIDKAITKLEETNKVKEQTINGERGYEVAILNIDKELRPENYPKYESVKDENEKKAKLDKHIATLQERKEKYKQKIEDAKDEMAHNEELIAERKAEKSSKMAEVQRVIEDYTEEITKDKYVVKLEKIEELHSERELLKKEGKSKEEIEQYFNDKASQEDNEPDEFNSETLVSQDTKPNKKEVNTHFEKRIDNYTQRPYDLNEWNSLFVDGKINTPIGKIKIGENQFDKLDPDKPDPKNPNRKKQDRRGHIDYIYKTLTAPAIITQKGNTHVFIKKFKKPDTSTRIYSAITVEIDGLNVNVSSHNMDIKQVMNEIEIADKFSLVEVTTDKATNSHPTPTFVDKSIISNKDMKSQDDIKNEEIENDILFSKGVDNVGVNYIHSYKASGFPDRSDSGKIEVAGEFIGLPTFDAPQTVESVREFVKDLIGNRLYEGRVKGKNRAGFYNRVNTGIRVKGFHDVETIAHEAAHYLDYYYKNSTKKAKTSFFKTFKNNHSEFLKSVSYTSQKALAIPEGFAEFVRLYTTRYNDLMAVEGASEVVADFEATLSKDKELQTKLHKLRREAHKYLYQGHSERMSASSDNTLNKDAQKIKKKQKKTLAQTKQSLVDKNLSVKMIEEHLKGKDPISADKSAYKLFNLVGGAEGTVDMTMEYGVPVVKANGDIELDETQKSLDAIFKPLFDGGHDKVRAWENYAKARRGAELKEQGRENRLDDQMIEAGLKLAENNPEFVTIFAEYQEFNDDMLDFYVGMNLITKDQKASFQEFNKDYVPFHRVKETIAHGKSGESVASSKLGARLKGGDGTINNIMDNIYGSLEKNIRDAYMARAKSVLYSMLEIDGAEFAMKIGKDSKLVKNELQSQAKNVAGVLYSLGMGISKDGMIMKVGQDKYEDVMVDIDDIATVLQDNPQLLETWSIGHIPQSKDKMIDSAIINGKRVYFEINDPMLIDTLKAQNGVYVENSIMKFAIGYKNFHTWMITNSPLFYLTNAFRDTVSAAVISSDGFIPFYHTFKGMVHFVKKDKIYKDFMVNGGGNATRRTALGSYDDINNNHSITKRHFGAFHKFMNYITWGADLFEQGGRLGIHELALKKGHSSIDAASKGREDMTDFSRSGSDENARKILSTISFAKAAINSIDRLARRFTDKKTPEDKARLIFAGSAIAAFSVMLALINEDDERYKKLTKDQKSMFWWIYWDRLLPKNIIDVLKESGFNTSIPWKLPKPHDIGSIFGNTAEIVFERLRGSSDNQEIKDRLAFDFIRMSGFLDFPSILKTPYEIQKNEDWMGNPIETLGMKFKATHNRYNQYTPEIYKTLGSENSPLNTLLGASPVQIHYFVKGNLGLMGRMIDDALETIMWDEKEKGERAFAKNDPLSYFASRLQGKEVESRTKYSEKFYKYYKQMIEAHSTVRDYKKQKDKAGIESFKKDKEKMTLYRLKSNADKVQSRLGQIRKAIQNISDGKTRFKSAESKEKEINKILLKKHKMLEDAVKRIESKLSRGK
jgi:hypothetical protein